MKPRKIGEILTKNVDPSAIDDVWERLDSARKQRHQKRLGRWAFAFVALAALTAFVMVSYRSKSSHEIEMAGALQLASGEVLPTLFGGEDEALAAFDDGSRVVLERASALVPNTNGGGTISFELRRGGATFDIVPHGPRAWVIDAGIAQVAVLGTKFHVVRGANFVHVDVERGVVRVSGATLPVGGRTLTAGQSVDVREERASDVDPDDEVKTLDAPDAASNDALEHADAGNAALDARRTTHASRVTNETTSWKPLAEKGDFGGAYDVLGAKGVASETNRAETTADLLRLADVARLSGHPGDAVAPLERLLAQHRNDANASIAAFTLGKIRQDALGAPGAAAKDFETAIALGVPAALREDAFARRVEAYSKAGQASSARAARAAYEAEFPAGRYRDHVEEWAP